MSSHDGREHGRSRFPRWRRNGSRDVEPEPSEGPELYAIEGGAQEPDPDAESALVQRLRTMEWPSPPPGVRERCLARLLEYMDSLNEDERAELGIPDPSGPLYSEAAGEEPGGAGPGSTGFEQRHGFTRRSAPERPSTLRLAERPIRLATQL